MPTRDGPRVNEEIRVPQVRLIDQDGEMLGVMTAREAHAEGLSRSGWTCSKSARTRCPRSARSPTTASSSTRPQKKANEARKKQKVVEIKEVKVRPNIDDHDYDVKMRQMKGFIEEGDKVKVTLRFRGREMAHQDLGIKVLERIRMELGETIKVEQMPRLENRQMIMVLAPK